MKVHVIKTGSKGNCYIIESDKSYLILDAGASIKEIQKYFYDNKFEFSIAKVVGCLITHEHGDHAKYINDFVKLGIEIFMSRGTFDGLYDAKKDNVFGVHCLRKNSPFQVADFFCIPITSYHDAVEPLNFVIRIKDRNIIYITDTGYVNFDFNFVVDLLICEVNHSEELLEDNFAEGKLNSILFQRVRKNHLSKEQVFRLLSENKRKIKQLLAVHLSGSNISKKGLASEFIKEFGIVTNIAVNNSNFYF